MDEYLNLHLNLIECLTKFKNLKESYLEIVDIDVIKGNAHLHESLHINLYDVNKIIRMINNCIDFIDNNSKEKLTEHNILGNLNDEFFNNINRNLSLYEMEVSNIKNTLIDN